MADEPTGNLDRQTGDVFVDYILKANKRYNQTFIIATHDYELANKTNRIISINDGQVISGI